MIKHEIDNKRLKLLGSEDEEDNYFRFSNQASH